MNEFYDHDPEQAGEGRDEAQQVRKKPPMMNVQRLAVVNECSDVDEVRVTRKAAKAGEYRTIAKRTCRVVKYPMESTSAAASSRSARSSSDFTGAVGALAVCGAPAGGWPPFVPCCSRRAGPDRHHPSCSLQLLRQARDEDRVPARLGEPIVQSQRLSNTALQIASTS